MAGRHHFDRLAPRAVPDVDDDPDDQAAAAIAASARLWWERQTEAALRDLQLYPVQLEDIGHTTTDPNEAW